MKECVSDKTYILTKTGYKTISNIIKEKNIDLNTDEIEFKLNGKICNKYGKLETAITLNNNNKKNIYKLKTKTGLSIEVTKKQKFYILNKHGYINIKTMNELNIGDILITRTADKITSDKAYLTNDEAYCLGILYSINFLELIQGEKEYIKIPNINTEVKEIVKDELINNFEVKEADNELYIYNSNLSILSYIKRFDFINTLSNKIMNSNIHVQTNFIKGFFDINCTFEKNGFSKKIENKTFAMEILLILKNIGVIAEIKNNSLIIRGKEVLKYYSSIGFNNSDYEDRVMRYNLNSTDFFVLPNIRGLVESFYGSIENNDRKIDFNSFEFTRENIEVLLSLNGNKNLKNIINELIDEHICYEEIESIELLNRDSVFDFNMSDTNTYVANSFICLI